MQCIQFSGAVQRGSSRPPTYTTGLPLPVNFPHPIFSHPNLTLDSRASFWLPYILSFLNTQQLLRLLSSYTEGIHLRRYCVGCTINMNTQLGNSWHLVFSYESHKMLERSLPALTGLPEEEVTSALNTGMCQILPQALGLFPSWDFI